MSYKLLAIAALASISALVYLYGFQTRLQSAKQYPGKTDGPNETWINLEFLNWALTNNKSYGSYEEQAYRLKVFRDNSLFIHQHRNKNSSYSLTINKFADLTQEEFRAKYLSLKPELKSTYNPVTLPTNDIPESIDWRDKGIVAPVKNQGYCGSCWAFSAIAAVEGIYAQKTGQLQQFSEQQLVDCSGPQGNQGCNGGYMDLAFAYVKRSGIQTEEEYPYKGEDGDCDDDSRPPAFKIIGHADVPGYDSDQLLAAVAQKVVSVGIEADTEVFQFYDKGVIDDTDCGSILDHGVAVVGYGNEDGKDYWLVRNSWGKTWGDDGYVKILRQKGKGSGICGIASTPSYPTL